MSDKKLQALSPRQTLFLEAAILSGFHGFQSQDGSTVKSLVSRGLVTYSYKLGLEERGIRARHISPTPAGIEWWATHKGGDVAEMSEKVEKAILEYNEEQANDKRIKEERRRRVREIAATVDTAHEYRYVGVHWQNGIVRSNAIALWDVADETFFSHTDIDNRIYRAEEIAIPDEHGLIYGYGYLPTIKVYLSSDANKLTRFAMFMRNTDGKNRLVMSVRSDEVRIELIDFADINENLRDKWLVIMHCFYKFATKKFEKQRRIDNLKG